MTTSVWEAAWIAQVGELRDAANYEVSAARLRALIKTKLLLYTDIENEPAKFFTAHRHLVEPKKRGPGFCVRFTVQYNLFAGTVIGLGDEAQVRSLSAMQEQGLLGCFALTERLAGVNSGLVVQTTATLGPDGRFHIRSPTPGSWKNWISQGLTADKAVVVADLVVKGKSHGPHAFLVDMRVDGRLVEGISLQDMGRKTIGNDLDNAAIGFDIHVPQSALLARFARIEKGTYVQTTGEKMRIEVIGQRLLTGRVAVSQWALEFCKKCAFATGWGGLTPNTYGLPRLYAATYEYASTKKCWAPNGEPNLASIPHIQALFREANVTMARLDKYIRLIEQALSQTLAKRGIPSPELVEAIAVAKISLVEHSLQLCFRLKQEVGSFALMEGTGFEQLDFITMCKFAEGDSRILQSKLCRDAVRAKSAPAGRSRVESELLGKLKSSQGQDWALTFQMADAVCERTIDQWVADKDARL